MLSARAAGARREYRRHLAMAATVRARQNNARIPAVDERVNQRGALRVIHILVSCVDVVYLGQRVRFTFRLPWGHKLQCIASDEDRARVDASR